MRFPWGYVGFILGARTPSSNASRVVSNAPNRFIGGVKEHLPCEVPCVVGITCACSMATTIIPQQPMMVSVTQPQTMIVAGAALPPIMMTRSDTPQTILSQSQAPPCIEKDSIEKMLEILVKIEKHLFVDKQPTPSVETIQPHIDELGEIAESKTDIPQTRLVVRFMDHIRSNFDDFMNSDRDHAARQFEEMSRMLHDALGPSSSDDVSTSSADSGGTIPKDPIGISTTAESSNGDLGRIVNTPGLRSKLGQTAGGKPPTTAQLVQSRDVLKSKMEIIAFGDWGTNNWIMNQAMATFNTKFPNPDAVFLLGDNFYSNQEASTFDLFTKHVAPAGTNRAHYVILGNHDYLHGLQKQLTYHKQDARWILPSRYYFKRFKRNGFDLCVWFLDTEGILQGDTRQIPWLDSSMNAESPTCRWKIVNGHHPLMHATPILEPCPKQLFPIKRILGKNKVHMYLGGHHHNSQLMRHQPSGVYYAIAGGIVDLRSDPDPTMFPEKGRQYLWGSGQTTAFLRLLIDSSSITVEFHSGRDPKQAVLYSQRIS